MPEKRTIERAEKDRRAGKASSTQAGEFVREEMHHLRQGKHGARSTKQAIAIGLSKARRMGVKLPPPKRGTASEETREKAARDIRRASRQKKSVSPTRATRRALEREGRAAASPKALARQAKLAASRRSPGGSPLPRARPHARRALLRARRRRAKRREPGRPPARGDAVGDNRIGGQPGIGPPASTAIVQRKHGRSVWPR